MEGEEPLMPQPDPAAAFRAMALSAVGDFLLLLGIVFILFGVANFVTDVLRIKGSGEFSVGVVLVGLALLLLMRSRPPVMKMVGTRPAQHKREETKSDAYR